MLLPQVKNIFASRTHILHQEHMYCQIDAQMSGKHAISQGTITIAIGKF